MSRPASPAGDRDSPRRAAWGVRDGARALAAAGPPQAPVLEARGLAVGFPDRTLLEGLDVTLPASRLTCLLGPNGSGKTTLLRVLAGMLPPLAGEVRLGGDPIARLSALERARRLGVVLTGTVDTGLLRVADLVALGRYPHTGWGGRLRASDHEAIDWALTVTGAGRFAGRNVATLSDGERQRVLIARALAQEPAVLALDEPTAFVDLPRRAELGDLLGHLARECELAVLMTTHDLDLALRVADDVWLLADEGERSAMRTGAPEDLALSGAVGRAFASPDVEFDIARGQFVPSAAPLALAAVEGDGPRVLWARRALERAGLGIVDSESDAAVVVTAGEGAWEVSSAVGGQRCERLADVVEHVRGLLPRLAAADEAPRQGP